MSDRSKVARMNVAELLERLDNDRELLEELVSLFCSEFPGRVKLLREALRRGDLPEVTNLSHGLKGMLSNLSIATAASRAAELERMARAGETGQLHEALRAFEQEVEGLLPEVQAQMAEAQG